jgi:hypothetical protein
LESDVKDKKRNELFHIRVIVNHKKIVMLFDSGSQVNIISEAIVKILGLKMEPHPMPYPLGWVWKDTQLQVSK